MFDNGTVFTNRRLLSAAIVGLITMLVMSGVAVGGRDRGKKEKHQAAKNPDELRVVDCSLPGQIRQLGQSATYSSRRRPVRTTALDCQIRGGEYVAADRADYRTALRVWLETAEAGDPEAQYFVGEIYEKGLGTEPDFAKAAEWYRVAADQGFRQAQINLGFLYEKGLGVEQDSRIALEWYRKATGVSGVIMLESEIESIRQQLSGAHEELEETLAAKETMERELSAARQELDTIRGSAERSESEAATLESRVAKLEQELSRDRGRIAELQVSIERFDVPGPSIEIIDESAVRSASGSREGTEDEIVGRVEAPAGLASFTVDGIRQSVQEDGFFRFSSTSPRVDLVAVDLQGKRTSVVHDVDRQKVAKNNRKTRVKTFGNYHALVIGNSNYRAMPRLETAATDATALERLLEERYGFEVTALLDASYLDVLSAFSALRDELGKNDNLIVYFAGHGELDPSTDTGYWLPVDADPDSKTNWISSREISLQLELLPARHVLIVADSCYSGALTRSALGRLDTTDDRERTERIAELVDKRSRTALTSGGLRPVLDLGGGGQSIFARSFLAALTQADGPVETNRLWSSVKARVMYETRALRDQQVPEYAPIRYAGHEGGEFFFVPITG